MASEEELVNRLQELQKQLGKRQTFESALSTLKSLIRENYTSSSVSTRKLFYTVVKRASTVLQTRYTAPGYLVSGLELFEETERWVTDPVEKANLQTFIKKVREELNQPEPESFEQVGATRRRGYLFEGHLTVDEEPPQPSWLVQQNLLMGFASQAESLEEQQGGGASPNPTPDRMGTLLQGLIDNLDGEIPQEILDDLTGSASRAAPPASKEVVAKLRVIEVTKEVLGRMGEDVECAICKDRLVEGDKMQEMPCKHTFHPPCLKPWLDEHNSCPICRHELPTDDHAYESRKEREKELEEERRGAANALPGGEFMYV